MAKGKRQKVKKPKSARQLKRALEKRERLDANRQATTATSLEGTVVNLPTDDGQHTDHPVNKATRVTEDVTVRNSEGSFRFDPELDAPFDVPLGDGMPFSWCKSVLEGLPDKPQDELAYLIHVLRLTPGASSDPRARPRVREDCDPIERQVKELPFSAFVAPTTYWVIQRIVKLCDDNPTFGRSKARSAMRGLTTYLAPSIKTSKGSYQLDREGVVIRACEALVWLGASRAPSLISLNRAYTRGNVIHREKLGEELSLVLDRMIQRIGSLSRVSDYLVARANGKQVSTLDSDEAAIVGFFDSALGTGSNLCGRPSLGLIHDSVSIFSLLGSSSRRLAQELLSEVSSRAVWNDRQEKALLAALKSCQNPSSRLHGFEAA